ncbi:MAG: ABC transporter substrate-binding protein [Oscillospiraceae bacterium]|nr:ABC transporter substrate-binding protein [Oscillospiraceae bacterium]
MKRTLFVTLLLFAAVLLCACGGKGSSTEELRETPAFAKTGSMELKYAESFSVDYYTGGYKLITIVDEGSFFIVPEGAELPDEAPKDATVLYQPISNIYVVASDSMCLLDAIDAIPQIRLSGTKADGWYVDNARKAMENGDILFAGKYSEPDYELLITQNCGLAIENTMINHVSDVAEKLRELGIPVMVSHASYESHPLGRTEWIKLYGALLNKEELAEEKFNEQVSYLEEVEGIAPTGKTVAFFGISASGKVVARKSGDYISRMISIAGGEYVFKDLFGDEDSKTSTMTIEREVFFAGAKDADYIIYNCNFGNSVGSIEELIRENDILADFKAVRDGNVWITDKNMFQETLKLGQMIKSFHQIVSGEADELDSLPYLTRLH